MTTPGDFARSYAQMSTWLWDGADWLAKPAPIVNYLQDGKAPQSTNAKAALGKLRSALPKATGLRDVNERKTFTFNEYDYINNSIRRTFMGKACPWEIQETLQLASEVGVVIGATLHDYCTKSLGVDCGGFVAAYWGEACPHMTDVAPTGWDGISPRNFWGNTKLFPGVLARRRARLEDVRQGDAIIFFSDILNGNPDQAATPDPQHPGQFIPGTGSKAFHIGLVEDVSEKTITIAESSGGPKSLGGNGVGVRIGNVSKVGKSANGKWVHLQTGDNEWLYFVAPPWGWGPEAAYDIRG